MSGVVFMVCVPTEAKETHLFSTSVKKVEISENSVDVNEQLSSVTPNGIEDPRQCAYEIINGNDQNVRRVHIPMIKILEDILETFSIANAVWYRGEGDYVQVNFALESQEQCEAILYRLNSNNIGKLHDSSVSVLPCSIHYNGHNNHNRAKLSEAEAGATKSDDNTWNKIVSSKNTRLTVDQIVETVKNRATLTFDFICLILISTTMCALGLVENSTVYLLSSMVMSPMMGPVMAATFGSVIRDSRLKRIGVQSELLGLGIATLVGFCYGAVTCILTDKYGTQEWPTYEITSRGELRSLWIGCLIALLSGAAVALGILSDNIASLVGVAISTSLMPPAVNAGLIWSMASVYYIKGNSTTRYSSLNYTRHYSDNDSIELLILGAVSICLTLVNIVCIYFAAICIFKVKEVAPIASRDRERRKFWKYDIKNARNNNTLQREEGQKVRGEYEHFRIRNGSKNFPWGDMLHHSIDLPESDDKIFDHRHQSTWSHSTTNRPNMKHLHSHQKSSVVTAGAKGLSNTRRLSSIFRKEENNEKLKEGIVPKILKTLRETERLSDESQIRNTEKDSKLVFTKSKTFTVTPCETLPQTSTSFRYDER